MKKVLYIHGFASAGSNGSAIQLRNHLYPKGVQVLSPDVPVSPLEALRFLQEMVAQEEPDLIVATSMGALYAEQLVGIRRILVNPSFHMARLLMMRGMGKQEFRNKRADGSTTFRVDKPMIEEYKIVEKNSFAQVTPQERALVYGLFGTEDKKVNCQKDFCAHYGKEHFALFQGDHYLNGQVLGKAVIPLVEQLLFEE